MDEPYIEAIHFSQKACPYLPDTFESEFNDPAFSNFSRSEVSFFANQDKQDCALPTPGHAVTFLNLNEQCAETVVPMEQVIGLTFEPLCMVVTIAPDSRKDLFDQLLAAGRPLDDKLRVEVSYTLGLNENPNVQSITTNCQNSFVLNDNYKLDRVLQDEFDELDEVRENITRTEGLIEYLEYLLDNRPASALRTYLLPYTQKPSPPPTLPSPSPPPDVPFAPPPLPIAPSAEDTEKALKNELAELQNREVQLLADISGCVGSRTRSCGISSIEGPNPWLAKDGTPCRGYSSLSARVGDFCGCVP